MQYTRNAYDAHDVLCKRVPLLGGGGGGVLTVSSLRGCFTRVRTGPMGRDGRGLCRLDRLVPLRHAHDTLHVVGVAEALDVHVLPARSARPTRTPAAAMRAQEAARKALRCMHHRDRSSWRCVVELRAAKVPLLEDVPLEFPHGGLPVHQSQCLGGGKGIPGRVPRREGTHGVAPRHLPPQLPHLQRHLVGPIYGMGELPVTCYDRRERVPSPVFGHLPPHTNNS